MLGQEQLIKKVHTLIDNGFPRFIILSGENGIGKKTLAQYITRELKARYVLSEIKADEVRNIINLAYKVYTPTVYVLPDAEKMHKSAKNALLKVTEEPPQKAYFILTTNNLNYMLDTLISRGTVLTMDNYTDTNKLDYIKLNYALETLKGSTDFICQVCDTFTEIDKIMEYGARDFREFCITTTNYVTKAPLANALKIPKKLKLKEDDTGYDPKLFLKAIAYCLYQKMVNECVTPDLQKQIGTTLNYIGELDIKGIHKLSTLDSWIFEMRGV